MKIVYVRAAKSWCLTYWEDNGKERKQKQEWFETREEAIKKQQSLK